MLPPCMSKRQFTSAVAPDRTASGINVSVHDANQTSTYEKTGYYTIVGVRREVDRQCWRRHHNNHPGQDEDISQPCPSTHESQTILLPAVALLPKPSNISYSQDEILKCTSRSGCFGGKCPAPSQRLHMRLLHHGAPQRKHGREPADAANTPRQHRRDRQLYANSPRLSTLHWLSSLTRPFPHCRYSPQRRRQGARHPCPRSGQRQGGQSFAVL